MEELRIAVATHAHGMVDFRVHFNHLHVMAHWASKYKIAILGYKGLQAAEARNQMVDQALEIKCTHIMFLDADHIMPLETLDCLTQTADQAIVSGLITKRGYPFKQVVFFKFGSTELGKEPGYVEAELPIDGTTYEVGVCAFGCTLINLEKLQKLERPYFRDTCEASPWNGQIGNLRSDINLCNALRSIGEQVFVDTRVLVGHMWDGYPVFPQSAPLLRRLCEAYEKACEPPEGVECFMYRGTVQEVQNARPCDVSDQQKLRECEDSGQASGREIICPVRPGEF